MRYLLFWISIALFVPVEATGQEHISVHRTLDVRVVNYSTVLTSSTSASHNSNERSYNEPGDWIVGIGLGSYVIGAVGSVVAARRAFPPPRGSDRFPVRAFVAGAIGGSLSNAFAIHIVEGRQGNLLLTAGGAVLSQVAVAGVAGGLILLARKTRSEALAWLGLTSVMAAPFAATLSSHYVDYRTSGR
jgi:hypothetical protein